MKKSHTVICALALLLFALLATGIFRGATAQLEEVVYRCVTASITPARTALMRSVTLLCDPISLVVLCLVLLLLPGTRRQVGIPVSGSAVAAVAASTTLKHLFGRERPDILRLVPEGGYSFPSSHAFTSAAIGVTLVLLAAGHIKSKKKRGLAIALAALYPLAVGVSRIYLGVHHAGDVLGGWLLGTVVGICVPALWGKISPLMPN